MYKKRSESKKDFGIALVPEGLIEFIPEMKAMIAELNDFNGDPYFNSLKDDDDKHQFLAKKLSAPSVQAFSTLPAAIQRQLMMDSATRILVLSFAHQTEKLLD